MPDIDAALDELGDRLAVAQGADLVTLSLCYLGYLFSAASEIEMAWESWPATCLAVHATFDSAGQVLTLNPDDDCAASNLEAANRDLWLPHVRMTDQNGRSVLSLGLIDLESGSMVRFRACPADLRKLRGEI